MQRLQSKKASTCKVTRIILLVLSLMLWQTQAMAQGDLAEVAPDQLPGQAADLFSVDPFQSAGEIEMTIPSKLKQTIAAKVRQVTPPGDGDEAVETAFVFLFPDLSQSSAGTGGSGSSSSGTGVGWSDARQQQEVLWYVGLLDPTQSDSAQGVQISQTPAAIVPPSVTSDGSMVAFVEAEANMICLIDAQAGEVCDEATPGTGGGTGGQSSRQAAPATGAVDVSLSPDGSLLAYVPLSATEEPADYFVIRDLATGEESPIQITDESGQSVLQAVGAVDFSDDGMKIVFDALVPAQSESGEATLQWVVLVGDFNTGELVGFGIPDMQLVNPAFSHATSNFITFEAVTGEGEETATVLVVADISQPEAALGAIIQSLPPAWPGFGADDMSLYFIAPIQDAETGVGIVNIPVDLTTLEAAGDPVLVLPDAIFGDAYAAGVVAGGDGTGGTGSTGDDDDSNGDDDSESDDSDDTGDSGPFSF
ncbi:hypothetical protein V6C53_08075 [Desulfocurvibacter africanus]|uniref:TolB family protein n=1 Tax=Desulfocurvibacter africanus TaxID=873 RepID=UPI002FD90652